MSTIAAGTTSTTALVSTGDTTGKLVLQTNGTTTAMTIDTSQNVGIGTSSPVAKNHIKGTGTSGQVTASWILENGSSGTAGMDITGSAGASRWRFLYGGGPSTGTNALTESMCILTEGASAGNVGIGTSSPSNKLDVVGGNGNAIRSNNAGAQYSGFEIANNGTNKVTLQYDNTNGLAALNTRGSNPLTFGTADTERMRIDSSGNLLVGKTSQSGSEGIALVRSANTATYIYMLKNTQLEMTMGAKSSTDTNFYIGSGSSSVGAYGVYLTNQGNSWNAVSDERMKTIVEPIENAVNKVSTLRSVIGYYNNDTNQTRRPFLIAQDVQEVLPEAVNVQDQETGTLGMSYTDTIPLLVAAIKELKAITDAQAARIETLEAKVAALEAK